MRRRPIRRRFAMVVAVIGLAAVAASCGISEEPSANKIAPDDVPFGLLEDTPSTTAVEAGRTTSIFLLTKDRLVGVDRSVPDDADLADLLQLVVDGPTEVERSLGITSAVPSGTIASVSTKRGAAVVGLTSSFGDVRSREQLLALGQIVYTLTGQPGIGGVRFTLEGKSVEVPLADGTLSDEPLSRDDFEALEPA